ncbi:hypothetical protein vseg_002210 [Gypsophila vaccaria]
MDVVTCRHDSMTRAEFDDRCAFSCQECQEMGYGTCYRCANGCDQKIHEECYTASPVAFYSFFGYQPFYRERQQWPNVVTGNLCTACGSPVNGLMYASTFERGVTVFFHPCCMKLPHSIEIDDGGGDMDKFTLKRQLHRLQCQYCNRATLEGPIKGWAYVSVDQTSACHVKCLKNRLYEDWLRYAFLEESQGANHEPWWLGIYGDPNYDQGLEPIAGSRSSRLSSPAGSSQGQQPYQSNQDLVPYVVSRSYSTPSKTIGSSQGQQPYQNAAHPDYDHYNSECRSAGTSQGLRKSVTLPVTSRAVTIVPDDKRRILWKLSKLAFKIILNVSIAVLLPALL